MRGLSAKQELMLAESYRRHLNDELPLGVYYSQTAKGLVQRGLFGTKDYIKDGKKCLGFYITKSGIDYLKRNAGEDIHQAVTI